MAAGMVGRLSPCYSLIEVRRRAKGRQSNCADGGDRREGDYPVTCSHPHPSNMYLYLTGCKEPKLPAENRDTTVKTFEQSRSERIMRPDRHALRQNIPGCCVQELFGTG